MKDAVLQYWKISPLALERKSYVPIQAREAQIATATIKHLTPRAPSYAELVEGVFVGGKTTLSIT